MDFALPKGAGLRFNFIATVCVPRAFVAARPIALIFLDFLVTLTPFPAILTKNSPVSPFLATLTRTKDLNPIVRHTFSKLKLLGRYLLTSLTPCSVSPAVPTPAAHCTLLITGARFIVASVQTAETSPLSAVSKHQSGPGFQSSYLRTLRLSKPEPLITDYRPLVSQFLARKAPRV